MSNERGMVSADEARAVIELHDTLGADDIAAQAPALARTVIALHAIIEGRATAPTDDELAAHEAAGGSWLVRYRRDGWGDDDEMFLDVLAPRDVRGDGLAAVRWWPLASDGRACAWPVVAQRPAGCICDYPDGQHRFSCARQQPTLSVTRDEDGTFRVAGKDGRDGR